MFESGATLPQHIHGKHGGRAGSDSKAGDRLKVALLRHAITQRLHYACLFLRGGVLWELWGGEEGSDLVPPSHGAKSGRPETKAILPQHTMGL